MPWAFARDPITGDMIPDGNGGWKKTRTAENLVRNQLQARFGECWQDPALGSRLHDREAFRANPEGLVSSEAERTLERVADAGRIANIEVEAAYPRSGRVNVATRFVDTSSGQVVTLKVPVGG